MKKWHTKVGTKNLQMHNVHNSRNFQQICTCCNEYFFLTFRRPAAIPQHSPAQLYTTSCFLVVIRSVRVLILQTCKLITKHVGWCVKRCWSHVIYSFCICVTTHNFNAPTWTEPLPVPIASGQAEVNCILLNNPCFLFQLMAWMK